MCGAWEHCVSWFSPSGSLLFWQLARPVVWSVIFSEERYLSQQEKTKVPHVFNFGHLFCKVNRKWLLSELYKRTRCSAIRVYWFHCACTTGTPNTFSSLQLQRGMTRPYEKGLTLRVHVEQSQNNDDKFLLGLKPKLGKRIALLIARRKANSLNLQSHTRTDN